MISKSIWLRYRLLVMVVAVLISALTILIMANETKDMIDGISKDYAKLYAGELVASLENHINDQVTLSIKAARTDVITAWMEDENNEKLKANAYFELMTFMDMMSDKNLFIVNEKTKHIFFIDEKTTLSTLRPAGTINPALPSDIWYKVILNDEHEFLLNIDQDRFLNTTRVWINVRAMRNARITGALGTGIFLDPIIKEIFSDYNEVGMKSIVVNEFGAIQLDTDVRNVQENSYGTADSEEKSIFKYVTNRDSIEKLREYLKLRGETTVIPLDNADYQYMAMTPIDGTHWSAVTLFNTSALYNPIRFLPIISITLGGTVLLSFFLSTLFRRTFVEPFMKIRKSIQEMEAFDNYEIFGLNREDEFGELARSIFDLSDRLTNRVPVGMFVLNEAGCFQYVNPYFMNQFKAASPNDFRNQCYLDISTLFAQEIDGKRFSSMIKNQEDTYRIEAEMLDFQGGIFWAEIYLTRIENRNKIQYEGILVNTQGKKDYEQRLIDMAMVDKLTGQFNRQHFEPLVYEEIIKSERYGTPISLLIFDLDHFKRVNDTWGHDIGDTVLENTAKAAKECLRGTDTLARWGGEEFAVLMPNTSILGAMRVAEKIRKRLEDLKHAYVGVVTASFGVAEKGKQERYEDWFRRVDRAMFCAKENGRNQVVDAKLQDHEGISIIELHWNEALNTWNKKIDEQHAELFKLSNRLMSMAAKTDNLDQEMICLDDIILHTKEHFRDEILILQASDFPDWEVERHGRIHGELIMKLEQFKDQLTNRTVRGTEIFVAIINSVIVDHMMKEDLALFQKYGKKEMNSLEKYDE